MAASSAGASAHPSRRLPISNPQPPSASAASARDRLGLLALVLAVAAAGEWLRQPGLGWVLGAGAAAVLAAVGLARRRGVGWLAAGTLLVLTGVLALGERRLARIEGAWEQVREARVTAASRGLAEALRQAHAEARRLAEAGVAVAGGNQREAFDRLQEELPEGDLEVGVVVLERTGVPWAWAGRHRLRPEALGDSIAVRGGGEGHTIVLEARRGAREGRVAVGTVLLWTHPAVPDGGSSLAAGFERRTGVGLRAYLPGTEPPGADAFDWDEPTADGYRRLLTLVPVPPTQTAARISALRGTGAAAAWLLLLALTAGLFAAREPVVRFAVLAAGLLLVVRAPVGDAVGAGDLFSPATFFRPLLGVFSASAGVLIAAAMLVIVLAVWLWLQRVPRRRSAVALGIASLLVAPYLVRELGRGILPPADGVSIALWLTWQLALMLTAATLIVLAAALFRGRGEPSPLWPWRLGVGVAMAVAAAIVGVLIWRPPPGVGWPPWYTFLWTPALFLVTLPAPRRAAVVAMGLVAGTAATLVTWGAVLEGRLEVAQRDVMRLGTEPDPLAVARLEQVAADLRGAPAPGSAMELYARWRLSALGDHVYPVQLALWDPEGGRVLDLPLDSLDVPPPLLSAYVRGLPPETRDTLLPLARIPGEHYVLLARVGADRVLSVVVGPRTRLIAPHRLGRLLAGSPGTGRGARAPLYRLELLLPDPGAQPDVRRLRWRREGWTLHGRRNIGLPDGVREVHAEVDLRGAAPILVRGSLVVILDVALLALLWALAESVSGVPPPPPAWQRLARSFRARLAVALALFFLVPAAGFATWGFVRLQDEAERALDARIGQTLLAAVSASRGIAGDPVDRVTQRLADVGHSIDADLTLYSGGALFAASGPILAPLGIAQPIMDPGAFVQLAFDGEPEAMRPGPAGGLVERVGFRVARRGPPGGLLVLATPHLPEEGALAPRQLDLAFLLLLATLSGLAAAIAGAQLAARALSRPVAVLRRSALALGRGEPAPPREAAPPAEFEPVFGAFERMAEDVRASQAALEAARLRTATVLATVTTGVVGLDPDGRVLIANRRAAELLAADLPPGASFAEAVGPTVAPVLAALGEAPGVGALEVDLAGRRLSLQVAPLGPDVRGAVLAVNDITEVSRAARVLAWGEMARQVAHEIKNPLTPMRLGVQHLRRVHQDRRPDFERVLGETTERILGEIDRLDTIARAFSRFGAPEPSGEPLPLEALDLGALAAEVVHLYSLGGEGAAVRLESPEGTPAPGLARRDEVKEVLVNLVENARNAGAAEIALSAGPGLLRVRDDGRGIPADALDRIFEPKFSTTTSGSGLGLAIVRRLVEGWGGTIRVESEVGRGTVATVRMPSGDGPRAEADR